MKQIINEIYKIKQIVGEKVDENMYWYFLNLIKFFYGFI